MSDAYVLEISNSYQPIVLSLSSQHVSNKLRLSWIHFLIAGAENEALDCCSELSGAHPACQPIVAPPDDPFYSQFRDFCINFARSIPAPRFGCALGIDSFAKKISVFVSW